MFELRDLECFLMVVEQKSFHRAARRLHVTQPALSRRVAALERDLRVLLLSRAGRQIEVTEAGRVFANEARTILAHAEHARRLAAEVGSGFSGHFRLGYVGSAGYHLVPTAIASFRKEFPRALVSVQEILSTRQLEALRSGAIDVALHRGTPDSRDLAVQRLHADQLLLALPATHAQVSRKIVSLTDVADEAFVSLSAQAAGGIPDVVRSVCAAAGFVPNVVQEVDRVGILIACVAVGMGVALVDEGARDLPFSGVVYREISPAAQPIHLDVITRADEANPLIPRFIAHLAAAVRK